MAQSAWFKTLFYLAVFVFVLYMSAHDYSILLSIGIVFVVSLLVFLPTFYYPLLLETRINRLESFFLKQKNKPSIYIYYVLANRLDEEANAIMNQLLLKHKRAGTLAIYKAAYGIYRKDMNAVREAIPDIQLAEYRNYYKTIVQMEDGEREQALATLESIKKPWMRFALLAELERKAGRIEKAVVYAKKAFSASRGVQRYVLYKEYEREFPQAIESRSNHLG